MTETKIGAPKAKVGLLHWVIRVSILTAILSAAGIFADADRAVAGPPSSDGQSSTGTGIKENRP